nr:hypothetical protein [Tanacetum cinerariifolium]
MSSAKSCAKNYNIRTRSKQERFHEHCALNKVGKTLSLGFPQASVLQQGVHESPQVERTTPVQQESKHLIWSVMSMLMCLDSYVRTVTPRGSTDCIDTDAATSVDGGPMQNAHTTNFGPK